MSEVGSKLLKNDQYERFCQELMKDLIGSQAAIRAGYSIKGAKEKASQLLTINNIKDRMTYLKGKRAERCGVESDDVLRRLDIMSKANISEYVELKTIEVQRGKDSKGEPVMVKIQVIKFKDFADLSQDQLSCIESIKEGKHGIELKLHGKEWTFEKINRHIGFYEVDNKQKYVDQPLFNDIP